MKILECKNQKILIAVADNLQIRDVAVTVDLEFDGKPVRSYQDIDQFQETTHWEIIEKIDYQTMADVRQFGKFWDDNDNSYFGFLTDYDEDYPRPFKIDANHRVKDGSNYPDLFINFVPCEQPRELDPITMKPKEDTCKHRNNKRQNRK